MHIAMDVCITRDCQIDDVFHHEGEELTIQDHQYNSDCMRKIDPLPEEDKPMDELPDDPPDKTTKKQKK